MTLRTLTLTWPRLPVRLGVLPWRRILHAAAWGAPALALTTAALLGTGFRYETWDGVAVASATPADPAAPAAAKRDLARLERTLASRAPRGRYIVIDRTNNRLYLREGDRVLLEAACSTGSGVVLRDLGLDRSWTFDTPRGEFRVLRKMRGPVWRKPDWAFVEEGKAGPATPDDRFEYGALGDYALDFGNGYMIHGTLYERLLGRSVTHGCIRLGRDDLARVFSAAPLGTRIFVF